MEELAVVRVLDERGRIDDTLAGADGVSIRDVRSTVATARALEDLPSIAAVAAEGRLSDAQLAQVVKVADASDEHEWARRAPRWSPADLAQKARELRTPTIEDAAARRAARGAGPCLLARDRRRDPPPRRDGRTPPSLGPHRAAPRRRRRRARDGGSDTIDNLAAVCAGAGAHHGMLVPHGPFILLGNPHRPDGLALVGLNDLPALAELGAEQSTHHARAGPDAA